MIEPLREERIDDVARMLTRSFADDPLVRAICTAPESRRPAQMLWSFRLAVRSHCLSPHPGWILRGPAGRVLGVVLVSGPDTRVGSPLDLWFTLRGLLQVGWAAARRGIEAAECIAAQAPAPPFTYVRTLGIDAGEQRQGHGSRLLRHALEAAPPQWPVYLETARAGNVDFYRRHGFECGGEFRCLGVPVWKLTRPAART